MVQGKTTLSSQKKSLMLPNWLSFLRWVIVKFLGNYQQLKIWYVIAELMKDYFKTIINL